MRNIYFSIFEKRLLISKITCLFLFYILLIKSNKILKLIIFNVLSNIINYCKFIYYIVFKVTIYYTNKILCSNIFK
uniref:Uncharacterized protein n=1 Tax=Cannabis sativa TaxID=3483 RepID=A0A803QVV7_CANSA